eukprot:gnl/TRDRNA2_/TRDRNA2_85710_c0_seq1.p1 gnl/TRDRNA2_/TRDRNA2_85710_c0~~gnl/TRDRNA2_/TRDRNA2_85710_c0_seq1.p1  ORF type:complete len:601 (+),score=126.67 gnl/TRDRNA2_/TRDRNA2_85710_c0_seq1:40-1803(+)
MAQDPQAPPEEQQPEQAPPPPQEDDPEALEELRRKAKSSLEKASNDGSLRGALEKEAPKPPPSKEADVGALLDALTKCTTVAQQFRKKENVMRSIKQMERALLLCVGGEREHPAVAVEAARVRLNLGAMLSRGGRHQEALTAIRIARESLSRVMEWCDSCAGDPGIMLIADETSMLLCAAISAEAIEKEATQYTDPLAAASGSAGSSEGQPSTDASTQLYTEAAAVAEDRLPPTHPMRAYIAEYGRQAVCEPGSKKKKDARATSPLSPRSPTSPRSITSPRLSDAEVLEYHPLPKIQQREFGGSNRMPSQVLAALAETESQDAREFRAQMGFQHESRESKGRSRTATHRMSGTAVLLKMGAGNWKQTIADLEEEVLKASSKGKSRKAKAQENEALDEKPRPRAKPQPVHHHHGNEKKDIFAEYIREAASAADARFGPLCDSRQTDARKRLERKQRAEKAIRVDESSEDQYNARMFYTGHAHTIMMKMLQQRNMTRSSSDFMSEVAKTNEIPEVAHTKKLRQDLKASFNNVPRANEYFTSRPSWQASMDPQEIAAAKEKERMDMLKDFATGLGGLGLGGHGGGLSSTS